MRAQRLVSLLLLLQLGRRFTAHELARRLNTSLRTVHRDLAALREAGVPVQAATGPGGGFRLPDGYRARLPLTEEEVEALLVGTPGAAGALGLSALLLDARVKLVASLPADLRERAGRAARLFHIDEPRWFHRDEEPAFLPELVGAAWGARRAVVEYRAGRGGAVTRKVEPLGLVLKAGVWYLVGCTGNETRIYRVSRIVALSVTEETFMSPAGFDLVAFWERARNEFEESRPRVDVTVRLDRAALPALQRAVDWSVRPAASDGHAVAVENERVELVLPFERLEYAFADLVKLGGTVEVIAPVELREQLATIGIALVATYESEHVAQEGTSAPSVVYEKRQRSE